MEDVIPQTDVSDPLTQPVMPLCMYGLHGWVA